MFKIPILALIILFSILMGTSNAQIINFPDLAFKNALVSNPLVNTNNDSEITIQEASAFSGGLNVSNQGIYNLSGIEYFTALTSFICSSNCITNLNFSQNTNLVKLDCSFQYGCGGTNPPAFLLDFSNNVNLTNLNCGGIDIISINLNNNVLLDTLSLQQVNLLDSLNINSLANLKYLVVGSNPNPQTNNLTINLQNLDLSNNTLLCFVYLSYLGGIDSVDFTNNLFLEAINFSYTEITNIEGLENLDSLKYFNCLSCGLTGFVDLSNNTELVNVAIYLNSSIESVYLKNGNNQNIDYLLLIENPSLSCVEVDNVNYSNSNWFVNNWVDQNVQFNTYCRPYPKNICLVGLDSLTGKNLVVWEPNYPSYIDSVFIYRQASTANFQKIGSISSNDFSTFLDLTALPSVQPYKYKLTALDSNNIETPGTEAHKTIHLTINQGISNSWNLIWNLYEGIIFDSYKLYRGTSLSNLQMIAEISSNFNSYTDFTAPIGTEVYYQIGFENPNQCLPFKIQNYAVSKSNIVNNGFVNINELASSFSFYLNSNKDIEINLLNNSHQNISIYNSIGQTIYSAKYFGDPSLTIPFKNFPEGIYFIIVNGESYKFLK